MKKLVAMLAIALMVAAPAMAVEVTPYASAHFYDHDDEAIGLGVDVSLLSLGPIGISSGIESISTELPGATIGSIDGSLSIFPGFGFPISGDVSAGSIDLDILDWKWDASFTVDITERLSLAPKAGVDIVFFDASGISDPDTEFGYHAGADVQLVVSENVTASVGVAYTWLDTEIVGTEVDLDNLSVQGGVVVKF